MPRMQLPGLKVLPVHALLLAPPANPGMLLLLLLLLQLLMPVLLPPSPPGLVLKIFLALLPLLLAAMMRFAGRPSNSSIDIGVIQKFYVFQFFAVFIFQFLGGAVLNQVGC
jgi:hypothetical protein